MASIAKSLVVSLRHLFFVALFIVSASAHQVTTGGIAAERNKTRDFTFEVASIRESAPNSAPALIWKPNGMLFRSLPVMSAVMLAYFPQRYMVARWADPLVKDAPGWVTITKYDIQTTIAPEHIHEWASQEIDGMLRQEAVRQLLVERCGLKVHRVPVTVKAYGLQIANNGIALTRASANDHLPAILVRLPRGGLVKPIMDNDHPQLDFYNTDMVELASYLSESSDRPIVDQTGVVGKVNFAIRRREDYRDDETDLAIDSPWDLRKGPFRLVPTTTTIDAIAIDHIQRPTAN